MAKKGHSKRWILPELGLNDDIGSFGGRPVGSSPEFMPLDASLNKDVHELVSRHCLLLRRTMRKLNQKEDARTFSLSTPKQATSAYFRVYDAITGVAPPSERILQDIDGMWKALEIVAEAKGVYI